MNYPYLVSSAWRIVQKLVNEWQQDPYRWDRERDIQVELSSRLIQFLKLVGQDAVEGRYPNVVPGYEDRQYWSRIACEPYVSYVYSDQKTYRCHPDVVIWDDLGDPNSPPDEWPILWACEIKYGTNSPSQWDLEKLEYLLNQKRMRFGCWLTLRRIRAEQGAGVVWRKNRLGAKLWTCEAYLPPERT